MIQNQVGQNPSSGNVANSSTAASISTSVDVSGLSPNFELPVGQCSKGKFTYITNINSLSKSTNIWILDTGATDHITCNLGYFNTYNNIQGAMVNLPTGQSIPVTHIGNIKLTDDLWLENVLYIPSFNINIVSASKLTKDAACSLLVVADKCLL